jgi:protein involved in polysaccharide export with SLBB domain
MFKRKLYHFSIWLVSLFFLSSFAFAQTPEPTPENTPANTEKTMPENPSLDSIVKTEENLIHLGDLIDVDIVGSAEYDWRGKLTPEGFLGGINFIEEPIYARCRSEKEVASEIAKGYGKILKNPEVIVRIIDRSGRPISLLYGAIRTPQRFQIQRPVRLNELLILSGGITEKASGEIQILRAPSLSCDSQKLTDEKQATTNGEPQEKLISAKQENDSQYINIKISDLLKGEPANNPLILSGDVVTVLEAELIYVTGGVANPKQINARSQITLSRAIDAAGGFTKDADQKSIIIFRREKDETKTIEINFEKIISSQEKDFELQALDIVEVTRTGRGKSKFLPVINTVENRTEKNINPPLRIID